MKDRATVAGVDVGCHRHRVAIANPQGKITEEFDLYVGLKGFKYFFARLEYYKRRYEAPVIVAMEGYNGYARPLDQEVQRRGYTLLNVNNLKLRHFTPYVGPMIIEDAKRMMELKGKIKELEGQIDELLKTSPLGQLINSIPGFGVVSTAEIVGEVGSISRFDTESSLAMYLGMAPLDNSSGSYKGTKQACQVNKRARAAMTVATIRHIPQTEESKMYYDKKRREGK